MNDAQVREDVLDTAKQCVLKDRNKAYGAPEANFGRIAVLWEAYLDIKPEGPISSLDVAHMMALMKIARLVYNPEHKDSWVDLAGYAACGAGIALADKPTVDKVNLDITFLGAPGIGKGVALETAKQVLAEQKAKVSPTTKDLTGVGAVAFTQSDADCREKMSSKPLYKAGLGNVTDQAVYRPEAQKAVTTKTFTREELKERMSNVKHYRKTATGYIEMDLDEAVDNIYNKQACQTQPTSSPSQSVSPQSA